MAREIELEIADIAFGGKGVGRLEGKAVFVPFTIDGEKISARMVRQKKSFAEAEVVRLIEPAPERVAPACRYFGRCGGCAYQHMRYEHQLRWKTRQVEQALRRIGKFPEIPLQPMVPSPNEYRYRNRITVHADDGAIGFFRRDEHRLIDVAHCPIAADEVNAALTDLRQRHPQRGHYTLRVRGRPRVFSQTNDAVAEKLAEAMAALLPERQALLIDAFCGAGFFAKRFAGKFERVVGLDWDVHAIAAAQAGATAKESYFSGALAAQLADELRRADLSLTTVIVDPPATGLTNEVREVLREYPVATLLYVSCDPPTMARDLRELAESFALPSVTPFDMFPQTAEIEVLAHLIGHPERSAAESKDTVA